MLKTRYYRWCKCCQFQTSLPQMFGKAHPDIHHKFISTAYLYIDLLSKYLGTRVFDWPRGNFHLARSPLYRERSGKLEVFQRERLETGRRQLKIYPCRTVSVGGLRKKLLYRLRLFAGSFLLHLSHLSRIIVLRRVPVEGAT